ncbi:MAG: hypothetical protein ACXVYM_09710 [Gaiellaceae bacterium]
MRLAVLAGAALVACMLAQSARADGDPASDYLVVQKVFIPYDAKFPAKQQAELTGLVTAANKAGYKIRVAVIWSDYDLGAVTSLWRKPRTYARFLGLELGFVYKQRLLIVMPNGFGFNYPKHSTTAEYALLSKIPISAAGSGLITAAEAAVQQLAAAAGVDVSRPAHVTTPAQRNSHDRVVILIAVGAALAFAVAMRFLLRRRR